MTSRQSVSRAGGAATTAAATAAMRRSSATASSTPAAAVSKHNTRRTSRDARGEKAAAAAAAAAVHEESVATAAVEEKSESPMVVRSSSRGRSGSRSSGSCNVGHSSRQQPGVHDGPASGSATSPIVGPRQGAAMPVGMGSSPLARPAQHGGGEGAVVGKGSSGTKGGRVQHSASVGSLVQAMTMAKQDEGFAYFSSGPRKDGGGAATKAGAARVKQSHAGQGGARVVRRAHGKSVPSPRTPARAQFETVQGGKRKRKEAPSSRGAAGIPITAEDVKMVTATAAAAPAVSPAAQQAVAKPLQHPAASAKGGQPHVVEKGYAMQLKQASSGNGAVVERFDKFPRMLQDKEKFALLRAIERCPEPENVASFITKGKAKYEFWKQNILTPVVNNLEGDKEYRGNARELFGSIQYFTAIYNWVRNQKKQLGDFYANPDRSGKDDFDFSGQTALMEARRKAFKHSLPSSTGGKDVAPAKRKAPETGNASEKGKASEKVKRKGKSKAVAAVTTTTAAAAPITSRSNPPNLSGKPAENQSAENAGGDDGLVRKEKSRHKGQKDCRGSPSGGEGGASDNFDRLNGTGGHGSGDGNVDGGGGESKDNGVPVMSGGGHEKANGAGVAASALSVSGMWDPEVSDPTGGLGDTDRNPSPKRGNQGGTKAVRQGTKGTTDFEKRITEDLAKLAEAVKGGGSSTTAVPPPNALDIAAQRLKAAQFLWQLKKEGCQSVEVDDKTIWELALKSADI